MMKYVSALLGIILSILVAGPAPAATVMEIGLGGGINDNLFQDSTAVSDAYASPSLSLMYYPSGSLQFSLGGSGTVFRRTTDLNSVAASAGIAWILSGKTSPLSLYLSSGISTRRYGTVYEIYDRSQVTATAAAHLRLAPAVHLKAGGIFAADAYPNAATGDHNGLGLFTGINTTFFGNNSLDLEGGLDMTGFSGLSALPPGNGNSAVTSETVQDDLKTLYFSIRLSRPLGPATGLRVEYASRSFVGDDNVLTYGFTLDDLSPWSSFWEGESISAGIKTYLIPNTIVTADCAYRDIVFMDALDLVDVNGVDTYSVSSRADTRAALSLGLRRPFTLPSGRLLTPHLSVTYMHNRSTEPLYDFSSLAVFTGLDFRL